MPTPTSKKLLLWLAAHSPSTDTHVDRQFRDTKTTVVKLLREMETIEKLKESRPSPDDIEKMSGILMKLAESGRRGIDGQLVNYNSAIINSGLSKDLEVPILLRKEIHEKLHELCEYVSDNGEIAPVIKRFVP